MNRAVYFTILQGIHNLKPSQCRINIYSGNKYPYIEMSLNTLIMNYICDHDLDPCSQIKTHVENGLH